MTAKKKNIKSKTDLKDEINRLMTPDAAKELSGLSPTFQQFLIRWTDLRDFALMDDVKEFIRDIYEKDNEQMCKNVASVVGKQLAEVLTPWNSRLERIEDGQKEILDKLRGMDDRLLVVEKRVTIIEEERLSKVEKYTKLMPTIYRGLITVIIAVILSLSLFYILTNNKISSIEKMLESQIKTEVVE